MSKNLDKKVRLQSERRERLQGIAEGASSAPRLASSLVASSPGRNECPGTHCSIIEQEREARSATEFEVKAKVDESQIGGEVAEWFVLSRPAKSVQNGTGFSRKT